MFNPILSFLKMNIALFLCVYVVLLIFRQAIKSNKDFKSSRKKNYEFLLNIKKKSNQTFCDFCGSTKMRNQKVAH